MSAPIIEVAEEVVSIVNALLAGLYAGNVLATREYNPLIDLKKCPELRFVVYSSKNLSEVDLTRGKLRNHEYDIQILVQSKLGPPETMEWKARIDELTELVEEVADLFRDGERLPNTTAYCSVCDIDPIYAAEHLDKFGVFSSVINLTFTQQRRST